MDPLYPLESAQFSVAHVALHDDQGKIWLNASVR